MRCLLLRRTLAEGPAQDAASGLQARVGLGGTDPRARHHDRGLYPLAGGLKEAGGGGVVNGANLCDQPEGACPQFRVRR